MEQLKDKPSVSGVARGRAKHKVLQGMQAFPLLWSHFGHGEQNEAIQLYQILEISNNLVRTQSCACLCRYISYYSQWGKCGQDCSLSISAIYAASNLFHMLTFSCNIFFFKDYSSGLPPNTKLTLLLGEKICVLSQLPSLLKHLSRFVC